MGAIRCIVCGSNTTLRKYFRFPNQPDIRIKWLLACNLAEEDLGSKRICETHFPKSDFVPSSKEGSRLLLKKNVIPSISLAPASVSASEVSQIPEDESGTLQKKQRKGCHQRCIICRTYSNERSYHRFPTSNTETKQKWLTACNLTENEYSDGMRICGVHFQESDFWHSQQNGPVRLKNNVVPTLFLLKNDSQSPVQSRKRNHTENYIDTYCSVIKYRKISTSILPNVDDTFNEEMCTVTSTPLSNIENSSLIEDVSGINRITSTPTNSPNSSPIPVTDSSLSVNGNFSERKNTALTPESNKNLLWRYPADIRSPHIKSPHSARRSMELLKATIKKQSKEIHNLRRKLNRAVSRIQTMKGVLMHLKKKNLLSDNITEHVMVS